MCCSGHQNEHTLEPQTTQNLVDVATHVIAPSQSTSDATVAKRDSNVATSHDTMA
jgi:hypothetical protein